jgi:TolB-like protein
VVSPIVLFPVLLAAGPQKLAAMDIQAREGVTPGLAQIVTDAVVLEIRRRARDMTVIASEDLRNLMGFETQKQKLGCQEMACLAEIGGALGVDQLVVGSLAKLGSSYILDLRLIDARHAKVLVEANERLKSKAQEELLDAAARAVATLFPGPSPLEPSPPSTAAAALSTPVPSESHPRPLALVLGGAGVVAGVFAVIGLVEVLSFKSVQGQPAGSVSVATAQGNVNGANTWATVGLITGIAAVGGLTGAVITW